MKKLISILLVLATVASLSACAHEHSFEEWRASDELHWQVCDDCGEKSDKEEHDFDEGTEENGVTVFTCKVCGAKKEGSFSAGLTDEEAWNEAIKIENLENVTIVMTVGNVNEEKITYKFDGELVDESGKVYESESVREIFHTIFSSLMEDFDNFEFDPETDAYAALSEVSFTLHVAGHSALVTASDLTVSLNEGKLESIAGDMTQDISNGSFFEFYFFFDFSDYGTTVVEAE